MCLVEKRANWSLSCTFFPIQPHIIPLAAGGNETDGQASKPPALSHFLLPPKKKAMASFGAQPAASGLSPAPEMGSSTFPQTLGLLLGWARDATSPPSEHPCGSAAKRTSQIPAKPQPHWRRVPARWVMSAAAFQRPLLCFALNFFTSS